MVKRALIYGGNGDLAQKFASQLITSGLKVDVVFRNDADSECIKIYNNVYIEKSGYQNFEPSLLYDIIFFPQGIFEPKPYIETNADILMKEFQVGLLDIMTLTRKHLDLLKNENIDTDRRVDFAYIGSTSAYAGFKNTAIYCAVKHGLLGFVRAMNDEYSQTNIRFWLFSMGSMKTKMGLRVAGQDHNTFLDPGAVAKRISESILTESNLFEPEQIIRRRVIQ